MAQDTHLAFNRFEGVFNSVIAYWLSKANFENTKPVNQEPIITQNNKMAIILHAEPHTYLRWPFKTGLPIALFLAGKLSDAYKHEEVKHVIQLVMLKIY